MQDNLKYKRILNKDFISLFVITMLISAAMFFENTMILSYTVNSLKYSVSAAGTIAGIASFGAMVMMLFCGPINNRIDSKKIMVWSVFFNAAATIGYIFFNNIVILVMSRICTGIGNALFTTSSMIVVSKITPRERFSEAVAYFGIASVLMQSLGPSIALIIVNNFGYKANFVAAEILIVLAAVLLFKLPSMPAHEATAPKTSIFNVLKEVICKESWLPATIGFLIPMANGMQTSLLVSYAQSLNLSNFSSYYFILEAIFIIMSRFLLSKYIQKKKFVFAITFSGGFMICFALLMGLGSSAFTMLLAAVFFGISYGVLLPVTQASAVILAPDDKKGSGTSTYFLGVNSSFFIAPLIGGLIADPQKLNLGYQNAFLILVIPCIIAVVLAFFRGIKVDEKNML